MSVLVDCKSLQNAPVCDKLHHMPCKIDNNGVANVEQFFNCNIRSSNEGLECCFRGRPLNGIKKTLPDGYTGVVVREAHKVYSEDEDRKMRAVFTFTDYTHWNLDLPPTENDKIHSAFQWLDIAKVLHEPVEDVKENGTP